MPKRRYARVAITLPTEELASADRLAMEHDRSRSWVIAEALRRYADSATTTTHGLGAYRSAQLQADLQLTPEQRVTAAEDTARARLPSPGATVYVMGFDSFDEYLRWKQRQDTGA